MEIQFYGANCVRITTKKASVLVDDITDQGSKSLIKDDDTVLFTRVVGDRKTDKNVKLLVDQPGEYEISDTSVIGVPARGNKDEKGTLNNTIFKIENEEINVAVIGNAFAELTDAQLELLGEVDILIIPVGGNNTLSADDALSIIKRVEPYIVIPTYFKDGKIKYETEPVNLEEAVKDLGMEISETLPKLKLKVSSFTEGDATKLVVLESQN